MAEGGSSRDLMRRRVHARALLAAVVLMIAMPAPMATGVQPGRATGTASAATPVKTAKHLEHRGHGVPVTKEHRDDPGRAIGRLHGTRTNAVAELQALAAAAAADPGDPTSSGSTQP